MTRRPRIATLAKHLEVALGRWLASASGDLTMMHDEERREYVRARATLDLYLEASSSEKQASEASMSHRGRTQTSGEGKRGGMDSERSDEAQGGEIERGLSLADLSITAKSEVERGGVGERTNRLESAPPWEQVDGDDESASADDVEAKPASEWHALIGYINELHAKTNAGAKLRWTGRYFKALKDLLDDKHITHEEIRKRATNMYTAPPKWPAPPYNPGTLERFWDCFAIPHAGKKTASDTALGRPDSEKHYGPVGEVDIKEVSRRMREAAKRGERYTGSMPMKGGSK